MSATSWGLIVVNRPRQPTRSRDEDEAGGHLVGVVNTLSYGNLAPFEGRVRGLEVMRVWVLSCEVRARQVCVVGSCRVASSGERVSWPLFCHHRVSYLLDYKST